MRILKKAPIVISEKDMQKIIDDTIFLLGLNSEIQLSNFFEISPSAISQWKKRGKIPDKYKKIVNETIKAREEALPHIYNVHVSVQEVMDALEMKKDSTWIYQYKKNNPRLYSLIEDGLKMEKIRAAALVKKIAD